jgi:exodeoxyribonuclease V gamma subunit
MFHIYHSNQLDILKDLAAYIMESQPLTNPLASEVILVQSPGMAQWIQIELAQKFDIAANIQFPLPASFIWDLFVKVLPAIPVESAFNKDAMSWKLMALLPEKLVLPSFKMLRNYLSDDQDKRKLFQLSNRIADLFDQYLVYRPDWLNHWQQQQLAGLTEEIELWQSELWRALVDYTATLSQPPWHRANLYQQLIATLAEQKQRPTDLPERVFICGISSLPPVYLQTLQALGQHIDVHLLFTNPCRHYWGDIQDPAFLAKILAHPRTQRQTQQKTSWFKPVADVASLFNADGEQQLTNPLLASWGKQGRDNLFLLGQMDMLDHAIDAFVVHDTTQLLGQLQQDILELEDNAIVGLTEQEYQNSNKKRVIAADDRSLVIQSCHSPQREVEVLQDYLLKLLQTDATLQPRDIIVMVSDIDNYAPHIHAVFAKPDKERHLPWAISDRHAGQSHPVLQAFMQLLTLPESRFTAEQVLTLLEIPALAQRFSITETNLLQLRHWVDAVGIRWGLNDRSQQDLNLPVTGQHTWQFGLQRMLLGYAMDTQQGSWQAILPYDETSGLMGEVAGQLAELLDCLSEWRDLLMQMRTLTEWLPICQQLIERFFITDEENQTAIRLIQDEWQNIILKGLESQYHELIPIAVLRDEITTRLNQQRLSQRFLAGPINFCTLMPMRAIPFKVVCLLGMNEGSYPRTRLPSGFDLMELHPRKGDRSRRDDDRYLFLEALLSARQHFYLSYIGRDIQDNTPCSPSVLVSELIEYVTQSFCLATDRELNIDQSAQNLLDHLVQQQTRAPFAAENFVAGSEWQSFAKEWLPAARGSGNAPLPFGESLTPIDISALSLTQFLTFWRHPIQAWFNQRLQVRFTHGDTELAESEPFELDALERYQFNQVLLDALIHRQDMDSLFQQQRLAGLLPTGAFGQLFWQKQYQEMAGIAEFVLPQRTTPQPLEIDITLAGCQLTGWLSAMQSDGILRWRPAKLNLSDGLQLYIEHLLICSIGHAGVSRMYGRGDTCWLFLPIEAETAYQQLETLLAGYQAGMTQPLWLLKGCAAAWLTECVNTRDAQKPIIDWEHAVQAKAMQKLQQVWQGNYLVPGEGQDPYLQCLSRTLAEPQIMAIIAAAERWYLPVIQAHQPE